MRLHVVCLWLSRCRITAVGGTARFHFPSSNANVATVPLYETHAGMRALRRVFTTACFPGSLTGGCALTVSANSCLTLAWWLSWNVFLVYLIVAGKPLARTRGSLATTFNRKSA